MSFDQSQSTVAPGCFEYEDSSGNTLLIEPSNVTGFVRVTVHQSWEAGRTVVVPKEGIAGPALGLLEAAGVSTRVGVTGLAGAARLLKAHEQERMERAAREAEDKVIREWMSLVYTYPKDLPVDDEMRARYRASMRHHSKYDDVVEAEVVDDREVIGFGEPEPDPGSRWVKASGQRIHHNGQGWVVTGIPESEPYRWQDYVEDSFPMTRVGAK